MSETNLLAPDYVVRRGGLSNPLFSVVGRTAMLTGASGHLVSEMVQALTDAGVNVIPLDITDGFDVTKRHDWVKALDHACHDYGQVDILVNGANANSDTPFLEIDQHDWERIFEVQLTGTMLGCQVVGDHMVRHGNGSIINISSAASQIPVSTAFAYSAAKAGVTNLTRSLAREWGSSGVRVNALQPGFFPRPGKEHPLEWSIMGHTPMKRYGEPHELVGALIWLASDASSFVTGAEIAVDGGFQAMTV